MAGLRLGAYLSFLLLLAGCGSIAKGVTEAVLEKSEAEDTRACYIEGPASLGLEALLSKQEIDRAAGRTSGEVKLLMVHGIGHHLPGYSGRLTEHLMRALGLDVRSEIRKEITLQDPTVVDRSLGNLRITRFTNKANSRVLLFYELTWSGIIEQEKKAIEFDNSGEYAFRRTGLNNLMKSFFNSHVPDSLIYLGDSQVAILASVRQSICWATWGDWDDYPVKSDKTCDILAKSRARQLFEDDYAFITHSLGSRIIIDSIQFAAEDVAGRTEPAVLELRKFFRTQEFPVFMLANQLPLLQLGRKPRAVTSPSGLISLCPT